MVVHRDNENASGGIRLDRGRDLVKLWLSNTQKVFFLDVLLGLGSIVVCKQEKGRTESVYKAARITGVQGI